MRKLLFALFAISLVGCESAINEEEVKPNHIYEAIVEPYGYIADITYRENGQQIHYSNYGATHTGFKQTITNQEDSCYVLLVVSDGGWHTDERLKMLVKKDGKTLYSHTFTQCCQI